METSGMTVEDLLVSLIPVQQGFNHGGGIQQSGSDLGAGRVCKSRRANFAYSGPLRDPPNENG